MSLVPFEYQGHQVKANVKRVQNAMFCWKAFRLEAQSSFLIQWKMTSLYVVQALSCDVVVKWRHDNILM